MTADFGHAPEPDPLMGIDAQKWAQEFMRIWSGRWSEVDEALMIAWFANAIMRGFDEGQRRLRKQHGCELPLAEPKISEPTAAEPKQGSEGPIDWEAADQCAGVWKDEGGSEETLARAYLAIRAQLAEKDAKIESLARVKELEGRIVRYIMAEETLDHYCNGPDEHCDDEPGVEADLADEVDVAKSDLDSEARAILAARAKEESK